MVLRQLCHPTLFHLSDVRPLAMRLPDYSGPFGVGVIDLEVPVRNPRSFGAEYVANEKINRPGRHQRHPFSSSRAHRMAKEAKEAAHDRTEKGGKDYDVNDRLKQANNADEKAEPDRESVSERGDKVWNPSKAGAKTSVLHLSTVLFTIFYPSAIETRAERQKYSETSWMGRPKHKACSSFLGYLSQYGILAMPAAPALITLLRAQVPALVGAPLADPTHPMSRAPPPNDKVEGGNFGAEPARFPLIVFSHGLAGNRLSYSQFCGELASQGVVVCALEHRDGSGIASMVREPDFSFEAATDERGKGKKKKKGQSSKLRVPYFAFENVGLRSFAQDPSESEAGLRQAQLAMREAEVRECLYVVRQIVEHGKGAEMAKKSTRSLTSKLEQHPTAKTPEARRKKANEEAERLQRWQGKVDVDLPALVGHSFGGATVIEMQRKKAKKETEEEQRPREEDDGQIDKSDSKSPFPFAIILDPWVEPIKWHDTSLEQLAQLAKGEKTQFDFRPDDRPILGPAYVINSETFTVWGEHFAKLKRILHDSRQAGDEGGANDLAGIPRGWLMTLCGCQHLDFSDFPLLLPHIFRSTVGPRATITIFCRATYAQMGLFRLRVREERNLPGVQSRHIEGDHMPKKQGKRMKRENFKLSVQRSQGSENTVANKVNADRVEESLQSDLPKERLSHEKAGKATGEIHSDDDESLGKKQEREDLQRGDSIQPAKSKAANRFLSMKKQRKEREWRERVLRERKERGLVATVAKRTPSGNFFGQEVDSMTQKGKKESDLDRKAEERALAAIDFSDNALDVCPDEDADAVQKSLSDIVQRLDYKKPKTHSLMGVLFRIKGLHPGLGQPGKVLVHEY